jgi:hypothetical protein
MRARSALVLSESSGADGPVIAGATSPGETVTWLAWADGVSGREQATKTMAARRGSRRARAYGIDGE